MIKKLLFLYLLLFSVLFSSTGCRNKADKLNLSDLGGVYSSSEKELDLSVEISGRLSEGGFDIEMSDVTEETVEPGAEGEMYSNKLLRWGLKRSPNNKTPGTNPGAPELLAKYGGIYIGNTAKREIFFTFDEGYENGYTTKILDVLRDNNVKALFFITGPYLKEHQDLVRRMLEEGHEVGNHTINHPSLPELDDERLEEEVVGLDRVFYEKFGKHMKYLRPPKGEFSERTLALTQKLGYRNLFWSFAYDDWYRDKERGTEYVYEKVSRNLHNGAILLLHAVSRDNADALDMIIKGARENGYEIGNINEIWK